MNAPQREPNRLIEETSPYLRQHAHNPVDWFPWGEEARLRAVREDRPILLSVGYAACHWCHVMERESFENDDIAALMNEHFVCIKVDREERPDIDDIYMAATVAMSGSGGWPMTVFLTPDGRPFFAGTYFPPTDKYGRPGFSTLLAKMAELWMKHRADVVEQAQSLTDMLVQQSASVPPAPIASTAIDDAALSLSAQFDATLGGFGGAPKFPPCESLRLLLRCYHRTGDAHALEMATVTLNGMKNGGIYDHIGGGFSRYSTDARWLVPHFEKMLYDNAQLARVYLEAFQVTKDPEYARVARETLDYVIAEMQSPEGGYYSATDADSEGVEGKFFVFSPEQIAAILPSPQAEHFCAYYDITEKGNWEGHNVVNTPRPLERIAEEVGSSPEAFRDELAQSRRKVYLARQERVPPLLDDKVLVSWNALMLGAMAEGYRVLRDERYLQSATSAANNIQRSLVRPDGGLFRTARADKAHLNGYLEDYAYLTSALLDLYEAGGDPHMLDEAKRLAERMLADFGDELGAFFHTAHDHESLLVRTREGHDGALPNPNSVASYALFRLGAHFEREDFLSRASLALRAYARPISQIPRAFCSALVTLDLMLSGPIELGIVASDAQSAEPICEAVAQQFVPNRIVAPSFQTLPSGDLSSARAAPHPLLANKPPIANGAALYICRNFACDAPISRPADVSSALIRHRAQLPRGKRLTMPQGGATAEATQALARSSEGLGPNGFSTLPKTGWSLSRFGLRLNGYRGDESSERVLIEALDRGLNWVEVNSGGGSGDSMSAFGEALAARVASKPASRAGLVIAVRVGGVDPELQRHREAPFPDAVQTRLGAHCLHPTYLARSLDQARTRLGVDTLDLVLLEYPELYEDPAQRQRVLEQAFDFLEEECRSGGLQGYGIAISANNGSPSLDPTPYLELGAKAAHFVAIALPTSLLEPWSLDPSTAWRALAGDKQVGVLGSRPLTGERDGIPIRLAEPPAPPEAAPLMQTLSALLSQEDTYRAEFGRLVRAAPGAEVDVAKFFAFGPMLEQLAEDADLTLEAWIGIESRLLGPQVKAQIATLNRAFRGPISERWLAFQRTYVSCLTDVFASMRRRSHARSVASVGALSQALDKALTDQQTPDGSLAERAMWAAISPPDVRAVAMGIRTPEQLDCAISVLSWPALAAPETVAEQVTSTIDAE